MLKLIRQLVAAVCCAALSLTVASAQDVGNMKVSISRDGTVQEVLDVLCEATDCSLLVRSTDVDLTRKVSVHMKDATVNDVLGRIFDGSDVKWMMKKSLIMRIKPMFPQMAA